MPEKRPALIARRCRRLTSADATCFYSQNGTVPPIPTSQCNNAERGTHDAERGTHVALIRCVAPLKRDAR